ncbi:MAG: autotransporter domain-containing protein, partial [Verrucomicrobia bacterium]|nr:autotransporter domain-containing protein [Verrucomicrobiota bacterium]
TGSCIVAPGGSIGTLTVDSIEFNSSSTLLIELDPSVASLLNVVGTAALDGTVEVVQDAGSYERAKTYQIVNAGNITGQFNSLIGGLSGYNFTLREDGSSLYLSYEVPLINTHSLTGNRLSVANYINKYASNETLFLVNSLEGNDLKTAMDAISPSRNAFSTYIVEQNAFSLSGLLTSHIDGNRSFSQSKDQNPNIAALLVDANEEMIGNPTFSQGDFSTWILGFGELAHQKSSHQNPAFHYAVGGALLGFDHKMGDGLAGFALGYSGTYFHDRNRMGHGHINSYFASIYGNAPIGSFYFSPAIWGVFNETNNVRDIVFPGVSEVAKAHIFSWQLIPHLEAGYRFKLPLVVITPYTSADLAMIWQRGYQEHGASPFNATQKRNNSSMVRSETGLKFFETWEKDFGSFVMKEQVAYVFEKPYGVGSLDTSLVGTPSSFTVTAVNQNLNLGLIGMDFICFIGKENPLQLSFSAKGEFGVNYQLGELTLDLAKRF